MDVDLFADIVCPWCYIGSERLEKVRAPSDRVRHHPFFLRPDAPAEGLDVTVELRRKYGVEPRVLFARAEAAARDSGLELDLSRQGRGYPTGRAHTLLRHAEARGTQRALVRALYRTHFHDGGNVSDPEVLAAIAGEHGFSHDEVVDLVGDAAELEATRREAEQALRAGIRGVPFFVFDGRVALSGAQPEHVLREAFQRQEKES